MEINPINIINILINIYNYKNDKSETSVNAKEIELANNIIDLIDRYKVADRVEMETVQELLFDNKVIEPRFTSFEHEDEEETALDLPVVEEESENSPDSESDSGNVNQDEVTFQYKEDVVNFWKSGKRKRLSFNTVKARYKMVKSFQQLYSWEKQVTKGGTRTDKLKQITEKTLEKFIEAQNRKIIIHDTDL